MPHVNNFIFLKVSLPFCFNTPQRKSLGSKKAFNEGMKSSALASNHITVINLQFALISMETEIH